MRVRGGTSACVWCECECMLPLPPRQHRLPPPRHHRQLPLPPRHHRRMSPAPPLDIRPLLARPALTRALTAHVGRLRLPCPSGKCETTAAPCARGKCSAPSVTTTTMILSSTTTTTAASSTATTAGPSSTVTTSAPSHEAINHQRAHLIYMCVCARVCVQALVHIAVKRSVPPHLAEL